MTVLSGREFLGEELIDDLDGMTTHIQVGKACNLEVNLQLVMFQCICYPSILSVIVAVGGVDKIALDSDCSALCRFEVTVDGVMMDGVNVYLGEWYVIKLIGPVCVELRVLSESLDTD